MIEKDELVDKIETTKLERKQDLSDSYEKKIYLDDDLVLLVGYDLEENYGNVDRGEETVRNFYWYWEIRNAKSWDVKFDNHDKDFSFCESTVGEWTDDDRVEDIVEDLEEEDVCKWSEQDWIEDISEDIADEVLSWLKELK